MKDCENCKKRSLYVDNGSSLIVRIGKPREGEQRLCKAYSQLDAFKCHQEGFKNHQLNEPYRGGN